MKREILLLSRTERADAALFEDGLLTEYLPGIAKDVSGGIFKGIIERYVPGMQAAFVNIGLEKNGFLPLKQTLDQTPKAMQSKREILVQVKKAPFGDKAAYLTQDISLVGAFLIYFPFSGQVGVSSKITQEEQREELKAMASELVQGQEGILIRTAAQTASLYEMTGEWLLLKERWQTICLLFDQKSGPCLLDAGMNQAERLIRDYHAGISAIKADSPELALQYHCEQYGGELGLDIVYRIESQLQEALHRKVWLKNGGYLVIDPCEAMAVIDVNTGRFTGKKELEDTILKTNLAACGEIARQVRLRNLSGIILVDFIDMGTDAERLQVQDALEAAFVADRKQVELIGFTKLGLMEMTRKKDNLPLGAVLKEWAL